MAGACGDAGERPSEGHGDLAASSCALVSKSGSSHGGGGCDKLRVQRQCLGQKVPKLQIAGNREGLLGKGLSLCLFPSALLSAQGFPPAQW